MITQTRKWLSFKRQKFPKASGMNGEGRFVFTPTDLYRAVVAAGREVPLGKNIRRSRNSDIRMRVDALASAVDMTGNELRASRSFLNDGSTIKAQKSFHVGNALCAHAAYAALKIPWLIDVEKQKGKSSYRIEGLKKGGKRPDFIGRTPAGEWHVFEVKGRSSQPGAKAIRNWVDQATAINRVNNTPITYNIVSAAYVSKRNYRWNLLWNDPPEESDDQAPIDFSMDESAFFSAYYEEIFGFLRDYENHLPTIGYPSGSLVSIPETGVYIGLHTDVRNAVENGIWGAIPAFAERYREPELIDDLGTYVYSDGLLVRVNRNDEGEPHFVRITPPLLQGALELATSEEEEIAMEESEVVKQALLRMTISERAF